MKDNYSLLDSLRETIEGQVNAYTVMKGGKPNAKTLGANMAIDNIMSAVANQIEIEKLRANIKLLKSLMFYGECSEVKDGLVMSRKDYLKKVAQLQEKLKELEGKRI